MFEDIDEVTINNANKAIKDVYAKFQNKAIQSIISKEEILKRDFDNMFIFEDFFTDYLQENREIDHFKDKLIEDIVDLIDVNEGELTIEELYQLITTPEEVKTKTTKTHKHLIIDDLRNVEIESDFEIEYGKNHSISLEKVKDTEKIVSEIQHDLKKDRYNVDLSKMKSKKNNINNNFSKNKNGSHLEEWNVFKKKK